MNNGGPSKTTARIEHLALNNSSIAATRKGRLMAAANKEPFRNIEATA